jgi:exo-poly-alpha-galacturonosidase
MRILAPLATFWPLIALSVSLPSFSFAAVMKLYLAPQSLRSDEVTLLWERPEPASAGMIYEILRDGILVNRTAKTHFTATGLAPQQRYLFTVRSGKATSDSVAVVTKRRETVLLVTDYGAIGDGHTLNTKSIQSAIDACPPDGVVQIPAGVFLSGALFLKSEMTLEIGGGGTLKGSARPADYAPFVHSRIEGWEMATYASLINAGILNHTGEPSVRNISIRGRGTVSGGGAALSDAIRNEYPGVKGLRSRGRLICLTNAANVEVANLTLQESPSWTLHYIYSENVSCHGLTIQSDVRNGDGIDPDSSRNSYIFDCSFDTGDDCIAIKSGKNPEGNVINRPTENVRISHCRFIRGHGISIGSEMSGGVRGVLVENCIAGALLHGLQIKGTKDRGGFVEDVTVRNCDLQQITIHTALSYNNDGQPAPSAPLFRRFRFVNIDLTKANSAQPVIVVNGFEAPGHRTKEIVFEKLRLPPNAVVQIDEAEDVAFTDVLLPNGRKPFYNVSRSERVTN